MSDVIAELIRLGLRHEAPAAPEAPAVQASPK